MSDDQKRDFRVVWVIILFVLVIGALAFWLTRGYGPISTRAYEISSALYSACNRHDESRIEIIEVLVEEKLSVAEITEKEARWLLDILRDAKAGKWDKAMRKCRSLMNAQARPA